MKKFALILSIFINIVLAGSIGVNANQEPEIIEVPVEVEKVVEVPVEVEKIVEVPVEKVVTKTVVEKEDVHTGDIVATYKKSINGDIIVEFSDYSWAIINHDTQEYVFQPYCMGDWDMTFDNFEDLKMAMATYFQDANVTVEKTEEMKQSPENEILNPDKIESLEKELNKVPTKIKQLLIENGVEIHIQDGLLENYKEGVYTYGIYTYDTNIITMDAHDFSIETALIHEIGHALDDIIGLSPSEKINESYENKEINYDNDHFYSELAEYVAEGVQRYYNGTLDKNTLVYQGLHEILGGIK